MRSDSFEDRGFPSNIDAEKSILGSVLLDNRLMDQIVDILDQRDFFLDSHRRIFNKMKLLWSQSFVIDLVTLSDRLRQTNEFEQVGGATYIASLIDGVPRTDSVDYYVKIVKNKSKLRQLITAANTMMAAAVEEEDEASVIIENAERAVFSIGEDDDGQKDFKSAGEILKPVLEHLQAITGRSDLVTGVPTGFTEIDALTAGWQKKDLIIIAARPSQGKTALALNMAAFAARNDLVAGIFSLEMSEEQLLERMVACEARVDSHRLRTGYLNREEWARIAEASHRINAWKIFINDKPGQSVMSMRAKARRLKAQHGLDMLIVDYIQLMSGRGNIESRQQEVSQISRELKALAKELDLPVIAISQLSRAPETRSKNDHRPQLSDLRESGAIEQDADVVAFIYREELYDPREDNEGKAELIIAKQRNGPTGTVHLVWLKAFTRFEQAFFGTEGD